MSFNYNNMVPTRKTPETQRSTIILGLGVADGDISIKTQRLGLEKDERSRKVGENGSSP